MKKVENFEITSDVIEECLEECLDNCNLKKEKRKKTSISNK